jgi:anthranilate synthase/aminodeoxychorismate synthase-like glutamine amidotransferase
MVLVIDNYDSFTFNLVHELQRLGRQVLVRRNDAVTVEDVRSMRPERIVISPGPGHPSAAGICCDLIRDCSQTIPILGVCLGHQAIGHAFGARVIHADRLVHGEASRVFHDPVPLFRGVRNPFPAGRYHSLVIDEETLPSEFQVTAFTSEGAIMAVSHRTFPLHGVQFHPESILVESRRGAVG